MFVFAGVRACAFLRPHNVTVLGTYLYVFVGLCFQGYVGLVKDVSDEVCGVELQAVKEKIKVRKEQLVIVDRWGNYRFFAVVCRMMIVSTLIHSVPF